MRILTVLIIISFTQCSFYKTTKKEYYTTLKNGDEKLVGKKKVKSSKQKDQYNFYQRWDNEFIEYHDNGEVKSVSVSHFKSASYGRPCKELLYTYVEYDAEGNQVLYQKDQCDCSKSQVIHYNKDGEVLYKSIYKLKRVK